MGVSAAVTIIGAIVGGVAIRSKRRQTEFTVEAAEANVNPGGSSVAALEAKPDLAGASH
jgi:hypothetical protein